MAIAFTCKCGKKLKAKELHAGRRTKCPDCGQSLTVPLPPVSGSGEPKQETTNAFHAQLRQVPPQPEPELFPPPLRVAGESHSSPPGTSEEQGSGLGTPVKVGLVICVVVALIAIGVVAWDIAYRDTWQLLNASRVSDELAKADQLQQTDPLAAYKIYDAVLKEAKGHEVTREELSTKLANAEKSRTTLHQVVQDQLRAEEAERQRQAEAKARREEEEKQRAAQEEKNKRAADEAMRIAQEKQEAEEKRRKEAALAYRNLLQNPPQSARDALNIVKKVEARTEIGINYREYQSVVGEAWGEVKIFAESPEGKAIPDFSLCLTKAISDYKSALSVWSAKFEFSTLAKNHKNALDTLLQLCWLEAGQNLSLAEALLDPQKTEEALQLIPQSQKDDMDFEAELHKILMGKTE